MKNFENSSKPAIVDFHLEEQVDGRCDFATSSLAQICCTSLHE
jgi:hypothetical protein